MKSWATRIPKFEVLFEISNKRRRIDRCILTFNKAAVTVSWRESKGISIPVFSFCFASWHFDCCADRRNICFVDGPLLYKVTSIWNKQKAWTWEISQLGIQVQWRFKSKYFERLCIYEFLALYKCTINIITNGIRLWLEWVARSLQVTGARVRSRVFTDPRRPPATSDRTHTCDVTALSGPSLVYQYDDRKKEETKERRKHIGHCYMDRHYHTGLYLSTRPNGFSLRDAEYWHADKNQLVWSIRRLCTKLEALWRKELGQLFQYRPTIKYGNINHIYASDSHFHVDFSVEIFSHYITLQSDVVTTKRKNCEFDLAVGNMVDGGAHRNLTSKMRKANSREKMPSSFIH